MDDLIAVVEGNLMVACADGVCVKCHHDPRLPAGLVANELGIIFVETGDSQAEAALAKLLESEFPSAQFGAYLHLAMPKRTLGRDTQNAIRAFAGNPKNRSVYEKACNFLLELQN
jgi:hypothetical protein